MPIESTERAARLGRDLIRKRVLLVRGQLFPAAVRLSMSSSANCLNLCFFENLYRYVHVFHG